MGVTLYLLKLSIIADLINILFIGRTFFSENQLQYIIYQRLNEPTQGAVQDRLYSKIMILRGFFYYTFLYRMRIKLHSLRTIRGRVGGEITPKCTGNAIPRHARFDSRGTTLIA